MFLLNARGLEFIAPGIWDVGFGFKMGQIGSKWDKSGTFSDQISVHFCLLAKM